MNIMLINHYAGSPDLGMEYRPYYMAREWIKHGHTVIVVAASYSHLRLQNPTMQTPIEEKDIAGVPYLFLAAPPYNSELTGRSRNVLGFLSKLYLEAPRLAAKYKPNVVITSSTYPFDIYAAQRIAKLAGAPIVHEIHDIWPLTQIELYHYKEKHPMIMAIDYAQKFALKKASKIVSILPYADRYFKESIGDIQRYVHIPNGIAINRHSTPPPDRHVQLIANQQSKGRFIAMYCGSVGVSNALENFVLAAKAFQSQGVFVIVGNGGYKINLKRLIKEHMIHNIFMLDAVQRDQLPRLMQMADLLYVGAKDSVLYNYGIGMNKIYEYMLAGRPILSAITAANDPVKEANCGVSVEGGSPNAVISGIKKLLSLTPKQREEMGDNGKKFVAENHDYKVLAQRFLQVLGDVVVNHHSANKT